MYDYTGKTIFLGLDVHKSTYSLTAICEKTVIKRDKIAANPLQLIKYCKKFFSGAQIKSAYEAGFSGFYLHRILVANGIENIIVHPANIEVSKSDAVKTDKRDSLKIALQLSDQRFTGNFVPSAEREDKRHLTRLRDSLVKQRTRTGCQIKSLMHLHGMLSHDSKLQISAITIPIILKMKMRKNLRYRLEALTRTWQYFSTQISDVKKKMSTALLDDDWLRKVYCSVPGISPTIANVLINEIGDTLQFSNEQKLFSYTGLTPKEHSSGEHKRQSHITKQGNSLLRKLLIEAAWVAIKKNSSLKAVFERIRGKNKGKAKIAIVAVARTIIGRIRTCIKEKRLYVIENKQVELSAFKLKKMIQRSSSK